MNKVYYTIEEGMDCYNKYKGLSCTSIFKDPRKSNCNKYCRDNNIKVYYERKNKTFHCYRCGILLNDRPLRLNLQEYGKGRYKQYSSTGTHIDLCSSCFKSFVEWVGVNNVKKKV